MVQLGLLLVFQRFKQPLVLDAIMEGCRPQIRQVFIATSFQASDWKFLQLAQPGDEAHVVSVDIVEFDADLGVACDFEGTGTKLARSDIIDFGTIFWKISGNFDNTARFVIVRHFLVGKNQGAFQATKLSLDHFRWIVVEVFLG